MMDIGLRYCPFVAGQARRRRGIRPGAQSDTNSGGAAWRGSRWDYARRPSPRSRDRVEPPWWP